MNLLLFLLLQALYDSITFYYYEKLLFELYTKNIFSYSSTFEFLVLTKLWSCHKEYRFSIKKNLLTINLRNDERKVQSFLKLFTQTFFYVLSRWTYRILIVLPIYYYYYYFLEFTFKRAKARACNFFLIVVPTSLN